VVGDILVFNRTDWNPFGHVAIISSVQLKSVEIVQQNVGGRKDTRETLSLEKKHERWYVDSDTARGWLRKE
jgi:surface antigen